MRVGELFVKFPYDPSKSLYKRIKQVAAMFAQKALLRKKAQRYLCAFLRAIIHLLDLFEDDLLPVKDHANGIAWLQI